MAAMKLVKSPPLAKPNLQFAATTPPAPKPGHRMSMDQPPLRLLLQWQHTRIVGMAAMKLVKSPPLAKPNLQFAATTPPAPKPGHRMSMDQPPLRPPLRQQHTRIVGVAAMKLVKSPPLARASL